MGCGCSNETRTDAPPAEHQVASKPTNAAPAPAQVDNGAHLNNHECHLQEVINLGDEWDSACRFMWLLEGAKVKGGMVSFAGKLCSSQGCKCVAELINKMKSLADVSKALRGAGFDKCSLIIGIDFTGSNVKQGVCTRGLCEYWVDVRGTRSRSSKDYLGSIEHKAQQVHSTHCWAQDASRSAAKVCTSWATSRIRTSRRSRTSARRSKASTRTASFPRSASATNTPKTKTCSRWAAAPATLSISRASSTCTRRRRRRWSSRGPPTMRR